MCYAEKEPHDALALEYKDLQVSKHPDGTFELSEHPDGIFELNRRPPGVRLTLRFNRKRTDAARKEHPVESLAEPLPFAVVAILFLTALALAAKVLLMRKSSREMSEALDEKLATDTNALIDISSRDPHMRELAANLNEQLRQLRKERQRYQQGDLELKEAVTNISHDLRTPLTAINGYLDLLEEEEKSENARRYVAQIANRTKALEELTAELFRYSIAVSMKDLKPERVNLVQALEESLASFYAAIREADIHPKINLPDNPVWRPLDPSALNRIFSNIISNALKYSDGDLRVSMNENGCIVFENAARGIDSVTVGRLFDRYYTVEASRNSSGLGLSIAKDLTERMGGRIDASYSGETLQVRIVFAE